MLFDPKYDRPKTVSQVLMRAADVLQQDGWQRRFGSPGEARCVMGAVHTVITGMPIAEAMILYGAAREALNKHLGVISVEGWNDRRCRSAAEAIAALYAAAQ